MIKALNLKPFTDVKIVFQDGTLEALKWFALILMTLDHINAFLYSYSIPYISQLARMSMPLFCFVLGYNLARPDFFDRGAHVRSAKKMLLSGGLALIPYYYLVKTLHPNTLIVPLNVMFVFALSVLSVWVIKTFKKNGCLIVMAVSLVTSPFLSYGFSGLMLCIGSYLIASKITFDRLSIFLVGILSLYWSNGSMYALLAIPLVAFSMFFDIKVPRNGLAFYVYYPAHLAIIALIVMLTKVL